MGTNTNINVQTLRDVDRFNQQLNRVKGQIEAASVKINEFEDLIEQENSGSITDITEEEKQQRAERMAELEAKI